MITAKVSNYRLMIEFQIWCVFTPLFQSPISEELADKKDKKASLLPVESLREIYEALQALPAEQRIEQYKLKPDRADVIVPAAEIFLEVATNVKATGIIVPTIGLSDGIIDSLYTQKMNTPVTPQIQ